MTRVAASLLLLTACGPAPAVLGMPAAPPDEAAPPSDPDTIAEALPAGCRAGDEPIDEVTFEVAPERTTYRQGERILLALRFSARTADAYQLDAATYDRSGRLTLDGFRVLQEGTVDPLSDYFDRRGGGVFGGMRSMPMLSSEPTVVFRDLNEHVWFERPGTYTVQVTTSPVARDEGPVECVSEPFELTIRPRDEAADRAAVEAAVAALEDEDASEDAQVAAARTLRYSGSEAAARAMVALLARHGDDRLRSPLVLGLYATPEREAAVAALEAAVVDPHVPVTSAHVATLSRLSHWIAYPEPLGDRPEDEAAAEAYDRRSAARREAQQARDAATAVGLADALDDKVEAARGTSLATLSELAFQRSPTPPWFAGIRADVIDALPSMDAGRQYRLLSGHGRALADPALVPALRSILDGPAPMDNPMVIGVALARLAALAPSDARERVAAQIRAEEIGDGYTFDDALLVLPRDAFGSSLDDPLIAAVERNGPHSIGRAQLLARYASPAVAGRVRAFLAAHPHLGDERVHLYAYLLRVAPRRAARELVAALRRDISGGHGQGAAGLLGALAPYAWHPSLEPLALELLRSDDASVVRAASTALQRRGSDAAMAAAVERLRALLDPWRDDPDALSSSVHRRGSEASQARSLAYALWAVVTEADAVLPDASVFDAAREACVTDECRASVGQARERLAARPVRLRVLLHDSGEVAAMVGPWRASSPAIRIADDGSGTIRAFVVGDLAARPPGAPRFRAEAIDRLLERAALYPRGTAFELSSWPEEGAEIDALRGRVGAWLTDHGYTVAR